MKTTSPKVRKQALVRGLVQGVGFRPFVSRMAVELGLTGFVRNDLLGATIEVEGTSQSVEAFLRRLPEELPAPGYIDSLVATDLRSRGDEVFVIDTSVGAGRADAWILPDLATCPDCLRELCDPTDRRYGYPFLNCTRCGPRLTILRDLPYDRANTTMAGFVLCADCRREYEDPADRRFHAQPTACGDCGPRLDGSISAAVTMLRAGTVVAVKGVGGYHLAVDAYNEAAVQLLRQRKRREARPLAVMVATLDQALELGQVGAAEAELLTSPAAPVVLLSAKTPTRLAPSVAPGQTTVGVILAYSPLHHLLLAAFGGPLVMTSGNLSDEPIAYLDSDAAERFRGVADLVLSHNRPIERRCDDSVVRVWRNRQLLLRRARGYAPLPLSLTDGGTEVVLAVGPQQKNTFCLTRGAEAFLSPHLGDLDNESALDSFECCCADYERLLRVRPSALACDQHPDYAASLYARRRSNLEGLPLFEVQHHHAHLASCLADNGRSDRVLGLCLDGTGWGPDGTVWGGDLLVGDLRGYERLGSLLPFALLGGEAAVRQGWRVALALGQAAGLALSAADLGAPEDAFEAVQSVLEGSSASIVTSSCGRLFDGVAALLGIASQSRYEGEAAVLLEGAAVDNLDEAPFEVIQGSCALQLDWRPAVAWLWQRRKAGAPACTLAGAFHAGLATGLRALCQAASSECTRTTVALSGGCLVNVRLLSDLADRLHNASYEVLIHRRVPPNDGGLSLGQAAVARALLAGDS